MSLRGIADHDGWCWLLVTRTGEQRSTGEERATWCEAAGSERWRSDELKDDVRTTPFATVRSKADDERSAWCEAASSERRRSGELKDDVRTTPFAAVSSKAD